MHRLSAVMVDYTTRSCDGEGLTDPTLWDRLALKIEYTPGGSLGSQAERVAGMLPTPMT